jgi:hypothetical protein
LGSLLLQTTGGNQVMEKTNWFCGN